VVLLSAQSQSPGSKDALAELCRLYWFPLYAFVRRHGHNPEDAKDVVQGFFLHLLDHKVLAQVDPLKGKFRSFLLASIQNYLAKEGDRGRCLKRGGNVEFVRLDPENAETLYLLEPANCLTPETIFDARWATTLLDEVMSRLGGEYAEQGKSATFQTLKPFLDPKNAQVLPSYEVLANQLQVTLGAVKTLIHRLRKQHAYLLRQEVARTVCDPTEVDEEIHALCSALIAAEGHLEHENAIRRS
jgi:RNA polymerase sigma factor (sigma-70 family)